MTRNFLYKAVLFSLCISCNPLSENLDFITSESNLEDSLEDDFGFEPSSNKKNSNRLQELFRYEKKSKVSKPKLYYSAKKKLKNTDYTKKFLAVLKHSFTEWSFYACENKDPDRKKILLENLIGCRILSIEENSKQYYLKPRDYFAKFLTKNGKLIDMENSLKFHSKDGLSGNKHEWLRLYKHLGPRNGCIMNIIFPIEELNNRNSSHYLIEKMYWIDTEEACFVKLRNETNGELIYLKSEKNRKIDPDIKWLTPNTPLNLYLKSKKGDSRILKGFMYGATGLNVTILSGTAALFFLASPIITALSITGGAVGYEAHKKHNKSKYKTTENKVKKREREVSPPNNNENDIEDLIQL